MEHLFQGMLWANLSWDRDLVVVERLASSNDPQSYGAWSLVLLVGPPMAHRSEVSSPTNNDPATTAVKAEDGCSRRTAPSCRGLSCHRGMDVFLSSLCGRHGRPDFLTLNNITRRLLPRAHHQRPMAMDEWQQRQDREIWKASGV